MNHPAVDPADDARYLALKAHDARFDGSFFTGVTSTGIYCRPVCRVRVPRRENCRFFTLAAQAEQAGFRPCLRCRPELAPGPATWSTHDASGMLARQAARLLDDPAAWSDATPPMTALAARLGVSDRHLRRIFEARFGVAPHGPRVMSIGAEGWKRLLSDVIGLTHARGAFLIDESGLLVAGSGVERDEAELLRRPEDDLLGDDADRELVLTILLVGLDLEPAFDVNGHALADILLHDLGETVPALNRVPGGLLLAIMAALVAARGGDAEPGDAAVAVDVAHLGVVADVTKDRDLVDRPHVCSPGLG